MTNFAPRTQLIELDDQFGLEGLNFDRVLFLDFDGVLHPEGCNPMQDFIYRPAFCRLIREVDPDGELPIVISSSWRFDDEVRVLRDRYFPDDIAKRIVGVTPDLYAAAKSDETWNNGWEGGGGRDPSKGLRQREIQAWMDAHAPEGKWLAIDDQAHLFVRDCPSLFFVPGHEPGTGLGLVAGVSQALKTRLIDFLSQPSPVRSHRPT